jgi:uncharacterized protein
LHNQSGGSFLSLDDAPILRTARTDAGGFIRESQRPTFIDEVQRGGNPLVLAVKAAVDRDNTRGQFVLAGSTRFLFEPRLTESLAGRALFVDLWPFSQGEIEQSHDDLVTVLFQGPDAVRSLQCVAESRLQTFQRVCRGGMPETLGLGERERTDLLRAYVRTIATRDAPEVGRLPRTVDLESVINLLAGRTAQEFNAASIGNALGLNADVVRRVTSMLETVYLTYQVPAWSRNLTAKAVRRPKIHMVDTGVAAIVCGTNAERLRRPEESFSGALLESFVAGELSRQLTWSDTDARLFHWRDRDGAEVDLVLETPSGEIACIEVKAALDVDTTDTRGLRKLRDLIGSQFAVGVVLHCGDEIRWLDDRILAAPISLLWARY